jgi:formyltetrahydrofolate deformylase
VSRCFLRAQHFRCICQIRRDVSFFAGFALASGPRTGQSAENDRDCQMTTGFVLTVQCASRRGIVAAISTFLANNGCNITDSAQFDDDLTGKFFARISFKSETGATLEYLRKEFAAVAEPFDMVWAIHDAAHRTKVLLMVSNFGHCLNDLLYRWRIGALPIEIVGVISNHLTYQKVVVNHDIPFHHIRVTRENKPEAEKRMLDIVEETGTELVVLARYMQILSDALCHKMSGRIINIHHSFLPSFKGANPYKQAYERGVKLIGATSHYVTADLDEGPIIEQDTVRITHAQSADDYVSLGRDVESSVLARAIHAHIHHRVFQNGNKTVVFPASPGSYASERMG